jgi:hypothetical protein
MSIKFYAGVCGIIFLIIFALHLLRLIFGWPAQIAGWDVPMWLSWIAMILAGFLSALGFRYTKKK